MNLDINREPEKKEQKSFIIKFMEDLKQALNSTSNKNIEKDEKDKDIVLTQEEELEFEKEEFKFLQEYFKNQLSDLSKGEIFIVTNKYENDDEYHRYKVTQYKNNFECKYIAFEKDLPQDVQLGDVVRKVDGRYIYDEQETIYIKECKNKIKQDIINKRK